MSPLGPSRAALLAVLTMALTATGASAQTSLRCGDVVADSLEIGESHVFTFVGREGDSVVLSLTQDGPWQSLEWPQAIVLAPGASPIRLVFEESLYARLLTLREPFPVGGTYAEVLSAVVSGTDRTPSGREIYSLLVWDFAGDNLISDALDAAFGAFGTNTLFYDASSGLASPLVPLSLDPADSDGAPLYAGGIDRVLTPEQEALIGCGPLEGTDCDASGIDLERGNRGVLLQAFPRSDPSWDTMDAVVPQPGTVDAAFNDGPGGGVDLPGVELGAVETDPPPAVVGAHYDPLAFADVLANAAANGIDVDDSVEASLAAHDVSVDGSTGCPSAEGCRWHPFTGQRFVSELAATSWNLLMLSVGLGATESPVSPFWLDRANPFALGRCSYRQPQHCALVQHLAEGGLVTLPSRGTYTIDVHASGGLFPSGGYVLELACPTQGAGHVVLCHKGAQTMRVGSEALEAHLAHGDASGACPD